jgi:hypothetical protein
MRPTALGVLLLLAVGCGAPRSATATDAGITGRVVAGPQCPVVVEGTPCPDKPVSTELKVEGSDGDVVATVRSGEDGRFQIGLEPGSYVLEPAHASDDGFMFGKPVSVLVRPHRFTEVTVQLDTGIR